MLIYSSKISQRFLLNAAAVFVSATGLFAPGSLFMGHSIFPLWQNRCPRFLFFAYTDTFSGYQYPSELSYELIPATYHAEKLIRDAKDQPILNAAIVSNVDVILTVDKDFLSLNMNRPLCMTIAQFLVAEGI